MSAPGRIVILNGAPRSGKSSIARAIQHTFSGIWLNHGVDAFMATLPQPLQPGIGLRPGGERPDLEPAVKRLYGTLFDDIAAKARTGVNVVADLGIHEGYSKPLGILGEAVRRLEGLAVLFVGVHAPIETIMARRNADPQGGYYAAGPGVPEPVRRWQEAMARPGLYDLELDTSVLTPEQAAAVISRTLENPPAPSAFAKLSTLV